MIIHPRNTIDFNGNFELHLISYNSYRLVGFQHMKINLYLRSMVDRKEFSCTLRGRESCSAPWGMLPFDKKALSALQQKCLNSLKTEELRHGSVRYLMTHPEVDGVSSIILRAILLHRPSDPIKFAAEVVRGTDFRRELDRYLLERGSRRRLRGDAAELINPEAFSERKASQTQREVPTTADVECSPSSKLAWTSPSAVSVPSVDSLEKREDESLRERAVRNEEGMTRKFIAEEFFERRQQSRGRR